LEWAHDERVARITLAAPKANIVDLAMTRELEAAFTQCAERSLNAIVLSADGPNFSFGASVQEHLPDQIKEALPALHALLRRIHQAPTPVIAAVRGHCLGGGFEVVLACDLVIADSTAQFGSPEIKIGVFAPAASALLPGRIGQAAASKLLLTGVSITAEEALRCGLVAKVVDDLDAGVMQWLQSDFLPHSSSSINYACRAARLSAERAFSEDLARIEHLYLSGLMSTPDPVEGIRAFLEKRAPRWAPNRGRVEKLV
jgi:cyclohexa-1,5-dienecarbonyl-CoA hydratase